jgi:2-C-methyl-D-erythritol 4-phosphate cytidylyltransferase
MHSAYSAIIAAAGGSARYGSDKLHEKVGGKTVISHSLDVFDADEMCSEIIVAASPKLREWIESNPLIFSSPKMRVVDGGASRAESVAAAARAARTELLVIHDAARPNFGEALLGRVLKAVKAGQGAVPGLAAADSLALVEAGNLREYAPRGNMCAVQTPQAFERGSYLEALGKVGAKLAEFPDDGSLYLAGGFSVEVVPGYSGNLKLTAPEDLQILLKLMGGGERKHKDKYGGLGW